MSEEKTSTNGGKTGIMYQLKTIKPSFWSANIMEAFERLAYFGVRTILPLYMVGTETGRLGMSYTEKGVIFTVWALLQCLIPMISGGFTDNYGYKKSLVVAFTVNIIGYLLMGNVLELSPFFGGTFVPMLIAACIVGTGTAIFKPPVQGVVAKSLNESNSGVGFGFFYWVVNIGGFLAPMAASYLRGTDETPTWQYVFYGAAIVTVINLLFAIFVFREPERDPNAEKKAPFRVFKETIVVLGKDRSMLFFLLIVSGFWLMFMQLWDLLPNFIEEWVDSRDIGGFFANTLGITAYNDAQGAFKPEMLINVDSLTIIVLVLPLSWVFGHFRMIVALIVGMVISVIGFLGAGMTTMGVGVAFMIFVFAIGEIICSPKFSEYIGMTAPIDKKALYMGYSNIPFAIGWALGNFISGPLSDNFSSKLVLGKRFLTEHNVSYAQDATLADIMAQIQTVLTQQLGHSVDIYEANRVLWDAYNPWIVWVILAGVGVTSLLGMLVFYKFSSLKSKTTVTS
ncbi:MAG: MFS transporter [Bradymonadales bacterium]|jgi:MFS family permease